VIQGDALNQSAISTVICVAVSGNLWWADAPGNVRLSARSTGLGRDSVANVSQVVTLDKSALTEQVGRLSGSQLELVLGGIDVMLGRR